MTPPQAPDPALVAKGLTEMERSLFMGTAEGWGSWMFSVGSDLVAKGLGTKRDGSIYFNTPLGEAVRAIIKGTSHE